MNRFYAPPTSISSNRITLGHDETRHLRDVLRLQMGDLVAVFDGAGREFSCEIERIEKKSATLNHIKETAPTAPESPLDLTLAAAITKGERFDTAIQKAVELGVTRVVPLQAIRCVAKPKDSAKRVERWNKIALEATKQSGRAKLMPVEYPVDFATFIQRSDSESTFLFSERDGKSFPKIARQEKITAIVGPEGGWDDSELELAASKGLKTITLGGRILRTETAAISISTLLQHRFGDLC